MFGRPGTASPLQGGSHFCKRAKMKPAPQDTAKWMPEATNIKLTAFHHKDLMWPDRSAVLCTKIGVPAPWGGTSWYTDWAIRAAFL
mmetsp:Transcript_129856/g.277210  ORF Transcript_129856/g.277210 Transcript_129856/m.277210 type:complete len:86 (-) Transcript_129856:791-1048(-)